MELSQSNKYVMSIIYPGTVTGLDLNKVSELLEMGLLSSLEEAYRMGANGINDLYGHAHADGIIK